MANDFSGDSRCKAVYRFEAASIGADETGDYNLGTGFQQEVTTDESDYREGAASLYRPADAGFLWLSEAAQNPDFPLGPQDWIAKSFSLTFWFKVVIPDEAPDQLYVLAYRAGVAGFCVKKSGGSDYDLWVYLNDGATYYWNTSLPVTPDKWYHLGMVYDHASETVSVRLYSVEGDSVATWSTAALAINNAAAQWFWVGDGLGKLEHWLDEGTLWNATLTADEIDQIRQGIYGASSPSASASVTPSTSISASPSAPLYGTAEVFPFCPVVPIRESLEWRTSILKGADGSQQRICLRKMPRRYLNYRYPLRNDAEQAVSDNLLHAWLKGTWAIPIWPERVIHTGSLPAGSGSVAIDTRYASFAADRYAVIWQSRELHEVMGIASKTDNSLTFDENLRNTYSGTKSIVPCFTGRVTRSATGNVGNTGTGFVELEYLITDDVAVTGHVTAMNYDGYEVLTTPARMPGGRIARQHDADVVIVDSGTGAVEFANVTDFNISVQDHEFVNETKAKTWALRQWLHSIYGRQKAFLVPTFRRDFELTRAAGAGDTYLYVTNRGIAEHLGLNAMRTYVALRPVGGSLIVRKVTAITELTASEERLTLNSAPGVALTTAALVCWVDRCTLASDTVMLDWYLPGRNTCSTQLMRVSQ